MKNEKSSRVAVIGGGLAGCEAAWMLARLGLDVDLFEMRPQRNTPAHQTDQLAELVCSNSLGNMAENTAPGLLKDEMWKLGSLVLEAGLYSRVPAGNALGVDREKFSQWITHAIAKNERIHLHRKECLTIPSSYEAVLVATGPLTSESLSQDLARRLDQSTLYFYDSISPIVSADSIDYDRAYFGSRYNPDEKDYLNCPMTESQYHAFVEEIVKAEKVPVKAFEALQCFEACLPIEVLAERGPKTLSFGPMKPVGLPDPKTGKTPYAVVQLRRENDPTTMYNLVGFQTRMKWGEQTRIFRMIPGLENAEFVRMGSMHRNTYIESPKLLNAMLALRSDPRLFVAGQLTGVEGYVESSSMGMWAGISIGSMLLGRKISKPPFGTAFGGLLKSITETPLHGKFSPMNMNFGLFPPLQTSKRMNKTERRGKIIEIAQKNFQEWYTLLVSSLPELRTKDTKRSGVPWDFKMAHGRDAQRTV